LKSINVEDLPRGAFKFLLHAPLIEDITLSRARLGPEDNQAALELADGKLQHLNYLNIIHDPDISSVDLALLFKCIVSCAPRLTEFKVHFVFDDDGSRMQEWESRQDVQHFRLMI
jgi:hypothetical protein